MPHCMMFLVLYYKIHTSRDLSTKLKDKFWTLSQTKDNIISNSQGRTPPFGWSSPLPLLLEQQQKFHLPSPLYRADFPPLVVAVLMTDAGRAVLPDMSPNGFIIDKDILQRLQSNPVVWNNFCQLPDLYRRIRIDTIQIKKNQPELFESRLNKFIENTRKGLLYGEWNDNGRL